MRLFFGGRSCFLGVILLLLISSLGYVQILYNDTSNRLTQYQTDHRNYNEQQTALQIRAQGRSQLPRRSLLQKSEIYRYVLSVNYWEQLTMGMRNLFSLTCFASLWNMSVVQPFTYNSRLYGLPYFKPDNNYNTTKRAEDLKLIFNVNAINHALLKNNFSKMTPFQTFLMNAQRSLTVIHFISSAKEVHELPVMKGETGEILSIKFKRSNIVDCMHILEDYKALILKHLKYELQQLRLSSYADFQIVKYFCVNMSVMTTPEALSFSIGLSNPNQNESVITVNWRGIAAQTMLLHTAKGNHPNNRIAMNSVCKNKKLTKQDDHGFIRHSQLVVSTAKRFLKAKGLDRVNYAAIHIRSEKMGLREPRFPGSFQMCLQKLSQTIENLTTIENNLSIVYITDYGPYSSDTCQRCKSGIKISKWLEEQNVTEMKFDPTTFNLPSDSGFAAAVEVNVLASAKYLIVCGGGAFQSQVISAFYRHHRNSNAGNRIVKVCTMDSDLTPR